MPRKISKKSLQKWVSQETSVFNVDDLRLTREKTRRHAQKKQLVTKDTTEIFYEREKRRQWFWSDRHHHGYRWLAGFIVIIAVSIVIWLGPIVRQLFQSLLHLN